MKVTEFKMYAQSDMVSLHDYYGRAQGKERGLEIWGMAKEDGVCTANQKVDQGGYEGLVNTYPRTWLDKIALIDLAMLSNQEDDPCRMDNEDLEGTGMRWIKTKE
tara:strand:- start:574 stop:888 length:315 start_codon:yes stop_codon:yes gene_type:complete